MRSWLLFPQIRDEGLSTAEKNEYGIAVLRDVVLVAAKAIRMRFDLADELRPIYARFGDVLPDKNGDDRWTLPTAATYVIETDGTISLVSVDLDDRNHQDGAQIVAALASVPKAGEKIERYRVVTSCADAECGAIHIT